MSFPNIPDVTPNIDISREQAINLLLSSIAFEELGLSHIINSEADKIQFAVDKLPYKASSPSLVDLKAIDKSVEQTLKTIIKNQMLLQFKLDDILSIPVTSSTATITTKTAATTEADCPWADFCTECSHCFQNKQKQSGKRQ